MRVVILLLFTISGCLLLGRMFARKQVPRLKTLFYGLALAQAVMLAYIAFLAVMQREGLL
jgi:hypothetical protein